MRDFLFRQAANDFIGRGGTESFDFSTGWAGNGNFRLSYQTVSDDNGNRIGQSDNGAAVRILAENFVPDFRDIRHSKMIRKSYKFRIYPTKAQTALLENTLDLCRELYNAALQERRDAWKLNRVSISYYDQQNQLPEIKQFREDLNSVYSQVLQDVLHRIDKTYKAFFARVERKEKAGFPRFKSQSRYDSFRYPQIGFSLNENKLSLSKIGKIKIKLSRPVVGKVKTCTIKRETNKWFVIFSVETISQPLPKTDKEIGIDVGIESFATLSDGTKIENFKYFESSQKKLRVAQRRASRRKKGSNRRRKAVLQLKKIHQKIHNQRTDFQHKISTNLVKDFDLIAIEKLNISGMSRGILSKQINDVAWSSFFTMLKYKAESAGKTLIEVNPNYTSQDCSACGDRVKKDLKERKHHCLKCGLKICRDLNAAINIRNIALGQSVESVKYQVADSLLSESQLHSG